MKLILLRCPNCDHALAPGDDDLIVACSQCGLGVELGDEGLEAIEVQYAAPLSKAQTDLWRPWWVFTGQVEITLRETQSGNQRDEAVRFWAQAQHLYVPAWELSLQAVRSEGLALLKKQPLLQVIPRPAGARFAPVVVSVSDARKLLDYLVLTMEASRKDWLKDLSFVVNAGPPQLWALNG